MAFLGFLFATGWQVANSKADGSEHGMGSLRKFGFAE